MSRPVESCEERWRDEVAAYVLGGLDEREAALTEQHLEGCPACAERARWLAPAVDVLPATVPQHEPSPELRERLMAVVREEAADEPEPAPAKRLGRWRLPALRRPAFSPALAGLAVTLLLFAGVGGYLISGGGGADTRSVEAFATTAGSDAHGSLEISGDEGSLFVRNLPPIGDREVYQVWIRHGDVIEPSEIFVLDRGGSGSATIPHSLEGADQVMITREPAGGSEVPHSSPVLSAELS